MQELLIHYETEKSSRHFAQCALELQNELHQAAQEFHALKLLSSLIQNKKLHTNTFAIYSYMDGLFQQLPLMTFNWTQPPDQIKELFKEVSTFYDASNDLDQAIHFDLIDKDHKVNIKHCIKFVEELEKRIYYYVAGIQKSPQLYRTFNTLPIEQQATLNKIANELNINLDHFHGGVLTHLFQHVGRIPLLLKELESQAQKALCPSLHDLHEKISIIKLGISDLVSGVNQALPQVDLKHTLKSKT